MWSWQWSQSISAAMRNFSELCARQTWRCIFLRSHDVVIPMFHAIRPLSCTPLHAMQTACCCACEIYLPH